MRVGQNPAKFIQDVASPERITVAVLSYIPFLSGFYQEVLDVLKSCLGSIWEHTDMPYDLLVFDNGSGQETVDYLMEAQKAGRIQYLLLSEKNLGKGGAWNIIFEAAPGEIVAYSDSDALYEMGWLTESLRILEGYPNVGMVTSRPFRTSPDLFTSTLRWAEENQEVSVDTGQFVPWEIFRDFDLSLGQEEDQIRKRYDSTHDIKLTFKGLEAIVGASHFQFVARKTVIQQFIPLDMDRPMGQVRKMDQHVNDAGYLRLMTTDPLVMNMSNTLTKPGQTKTVVSLSENRKLGRRIIEFRPIKRFLLKVYNAIFRWYYAE